MERATRGRGKGGRGKGPAQAPQLQVTNRTINWSQHETVNLLTATRAVQLKVHRVDIKFTQPEWLQVYEAFQAFGDFGHRCLEMVKNRLKVVRDEYGVIKDLIGRSGWGWDSGKCMVKAPDDDAWNEICKESIKLKNFPTKSFPWYDLFFDIIGNNATMGELGQTSVVQQSSGTGSSSDAHAYDEVMEGDGVQQPVLIELPNPSHPSTETGGTSSARSRSSNKRKSANTTEGSRSQRAKRSISNSQQNHSDMITEVRELVKTSSRLAVVGEEFVDLAKKKVEISPHVMAALGALVLNKDDFSKAMHALNTPIEQQIFMFGGQEHQISYLNKIIPGFMQRNTAAGGEEAQYNPFFNSGFYGGPGM